MRTLGTGIASGALFALVLYSVIATPFREALPFLAMGLSYVALTWKRADRRI